VNAPETTSTETTVDWKSILIIVLAFTTVIFGAMAMSGQDSASSGGSKTCANWRQNGSQTYCSRWETS
jgi:hypothetical protein